MFDLYLQVDGCVSCRVAGVWTYGFHLTFVRIGKYLSPPVRAADRGRRTLFIAPTPSLCLFAPASLRKQGNLAACEKDADGRGYGDVLMCVGEQSGVGVNGEHLYFVAVAAGAE